jgi:hypothetical protein
MLHTSQMQYCSKGRASSASSFYGMIWTEYGLEMQQAANFVLNQLVFKQKPVKTAFRALLYHYRYAIHV